MLRRVALARTDDSEEYSASIITVFLRSLNRLLVTANVVPSLLVLVTLIIETSVLIRTTRCNLPEDGILHSHCSENLRSEMGFYTPEDGILRVQVESCQ
jgi:hypothetical protein